MTTADPHRVLLLHAFASLTLRSGSEAALAYLVHPGGMPVGHSVESTRPVSLCSIKANIAVSRTTNRPGMPCWAPRETVCVRLLRTVPHPLAPQPQTPQVRPIGPATPLQIQGP